jgi:hypothetical protein
MMGDNVRHIHGKSRTIAERGAGTLVHRRVYKNRVGDVIQIDCDVELFEASLTGFEKAIVVAEEAVARGLAMTNGVALDADDHRMLEMKEELKIAATAIFNPRRVKVEASHRMFDLTARNVPAVFAMMKSIIDATQPDVIGQASAQAVYDKAVPQLSALLRRMNNVIRQIGEATKAAEELAAMQAVVAPMLELLPPPEPEVVEASKDVNVRIPSPSVVPCIIGCTCTYQHLDGHFCNKCGHLYVRPVPAAS